MDTPNATDTEYESHTIARVDDAMDAEEPCFVIATTDSGSLYVANPNRLPLPKPGDVVRFYGRGLGYPVRGVVVGDVVYRYQTEEEAEAAHVAEVGARKAERQREWDAATEANAVRVAAMPPAFRQRVEFFMRRPEWGPAFGPYEFFVCEEAAKIAAVCATREEVSALYDDRNRQEAAGLDVVNHSGNTFGAACMLAALYIDHPDQVWKGHGAMCPLVGCREYGCWAATPADPATPTDKP